MNPFIKNKAKVILFPIEGKKDVVYGMDNKSGALVPFNFSRASNGTYFTKDMDMKEALADMPRVDYGNYSDMPKLLIEDERTNLIEDSMFKTPFKGYPIIRGVSIIEKGVLGFFDKLCLLEYGDNPNFLYVKPIINIGNRFSFSSFVYNPNNYPTHIKSNECIAFLNMGANIENLKSGYVNVKDGYNRNFSIATSTSDSDTNNRGWVKYPENIEHNALEVFGYQIEVGDVMTSFIPTYGVPETRKADSLSINISTQSSVLICDTKEKQVVDIQGLFKVEDYIQNDGLTLLAIFTKLTNEQKDETI